MYDIISPYIQGQKFPCFQGLLNVDKVEFSFFFVFRFQNHVRYVIQHPILKT